MLKSMNNSNLVLSRVRYEYKIIQLPFGVDKAISSVGEPPAQRRRRVDGKWAIHLGGRPAQQTFGPGLRSVGRHRRLVQFETASGRGPEFLKRQESGRLVQRATYTNRYSTGAGTHLGGGSYPGPQLVHGPAHRAHAPPERVPLLGHRVDGHLPHLRVARPRACPGRLAGQRVRALLVEPVPDLSLDVRLDDALGQRAGPAILAATAAAADETQPPAHHNDVSIKIQVGTTAR